jgi:hypothetical protein
MGKTYGEVNQEYEDFLKREPVRRLLAVADLLRNLGLALEKSSKGAPASTEVEQAMEALKGWLPYTEPDWPGGNCLAPIGEFPLEYCGIRFPELKDPI